MTMSDAEYIAKLEAEVRASDARAEAAEAKVAEMEKWAALLPQPDQDCRHGKTMCGQCLEILLRKVLEASLGETPAQNAALKAESKIRDIELRERALVNSGACSEACLRNRSESESEIARLKENAAFLVGEANRLRAKVMNLARDLVEALG